MYGEVTEYRIQIGEQILITPMRSRYVNVDIQGDWHLQSSLPCRYSLVEVVIDQGVSLQLAVENGSTARIEQLFYRKSANS
jgi:hypothetical protein